MRSYIHVRFKGSDKRTYTYVADGSPDELSRFTHAVVDSPYGALTVVEVMRVSNLDESTYNGTYKHVVTLFDLSTYTEQVNREERKRALEKELRRRVAQRKLEDNFAVLLNGDEEGMKLLEEYKKL